MILAEYTVVIKHECTSCEDTELPRIKEDLPDLDDLATALGSTLPYGCERAAVFLVVSDGTDYSTA